MKNIIISILVLITTITEAQIRLKQLEPCYDGSGARKDSCFIMTDLAGIPYYIDLNDLVGIVSKSAINCDSIGNCLLNTSILCNALGNFPTGIPNVNDYLIARNGTSCKRILLDSIIGGSKLCSALNFSISTVNGNDYFLIKKADGTCARALISGISGIGFNCDSVAACLADGSLCNAMRAFPTASPATSDSFVFMKNGNCRKGLLSTLISDIDCDSVKACLIGGGVLCDALRSFPNGTYVSGDSIWYSHNGECRKGSINGLIGGGSFNCDSVKACISQTWFCDSVETCLEDGALCNALQDFTVDGGGSSFYLIGTDGTTCNRIPFDSVSTACALEIELGEFGGSPHGCEFATSCNGGAPTNQHWIFPVMNGCKLEMWGGAEGQGDCLFGDVDLPQPTVTNQSTCNGGAVELKFNYTYCGVTTQINLGSLSLQRFDDPGTGDQIRLLYNGAVCSAIDMCPPIQCSGFSAPEGSIRPIEQSYPNVNQIDYKKIRRYKNHVEADKDKKLPSGGLYFVGKSRSLQIKL